ncbi:TPA: DUF3306 domain-containing protein [Aeromonas veronii]|uniref:DUF3306 domain-containing protein n=1 Tax=Aeromonas veronii TaxID=654 RepID=UPI0033104B8D|nr:DUF3306 domain-containing protein [Aeromonas veronii]HDO1328166.1 DUF3306 domain-containing protein [Aeromonas veronii]HDO1332886.1 DUF3306 domain-containing protein [Aeromonas veronii]HDO1337905.1 DUF3306 domain-containing protein [Aeromonas veronii]HDO1341958.1 DUF3306 domain-containing protein [Aeromonas veronii]
MSEFLKRWSSRKHQALQPREEAIPEAVAAPIEGSGEGEISDTAMDSPVVSTDKGRSEPLAVEGTESGEPPLTTAQPGKAKLPDKEALRAMFRSHKPDGLDDYTQDFSQPELLPAALTAGLRNWLVDQVIAPESESANPASGSAEPVAVASEPAADELADNHSQTHTDDRDILVSCGGQNVPTKGGGMEPSGS